MRHDSSGSISTSRASEPGHQFWPSDVWSFAVFQAGAVVPTLAGYTCNGLASTWHVIVFPSGPDLERVFDLPYTSSTTTVHHDLIYDFPPAGTSPAVHVEWRYDYMLDAASNPPAIRLSGTQHETPAGDVEHVFTNTFGTGTGIELSHESLPSLLAGTGLTHPFLDQARTDCG